MDVFLALLALVLGFLLFRAWQLMGAGRRSRVRSGSSVTPLAAPRRPLQWISMGELKKVLATANDLVVVDLRPGRAHPPLPVPEAQVLRVHTSELETMLQQLPENRSAAFCGASGVCVFMIETSSCMSGSAPLYILRPERTHGEEAA